MGSDVPCSDDLFEIYHQDNSPLLGQAESPASFTEEVLAWQECKSLPRFGSASARVVQRTWRTADIFRSEPREPPTSPTLQMADMASSPPPTPSTHPKRRFAELDLGTNQLARPPKAQRTFYGIDIHSLLEQAQIEDAAPKSPPRLPTPPCDPQPKQSGNRLLWTEKYRARKFTDLIGDERTHRAVMHWLKRWDQIVFPGSRRPKTRTKGSQDASAEGEKPHRKILLLTGPPGLGKTTLAHVCARQAGYEVQEINASDERTSAVVKSRIKDMVGTENVKGVNTSGTEGNIRKAGKPVCVVVDEVDGAAGGNSSGGGEGGFVKALIDLINMDQKNSGLRSLQQAPTKRKNGERFRFLRPLILICNDVYHPSLKPLRHSPHAEIIHVRKPPIQIIAGRLHSIFQKEGLSCETDGIRRLCEAVWGVSNRKEDRANSGAGEGDMRGIMVVGEWVAGKLKAENMKTGQARLTRRWVEDNLLQDLAHGGGSARGLGRGGPRDIVERVFQEGAGFPKVNPVSTPLPQMSNAGVKGVSEGNKRTATERLRELVDTLGDSDRIVTDIFSAYPDRPFQDDTFLSKPDAAYEWLHFHDRLSSAVFGANDWELAPYLSTPVLAFHHLFASPTRAQYNNANATTDTGADGDDHGAFSGPQASWAAHEAMKHNTSVLQTLQSSLSMDLGRQFTSTSAVATDLVPQLLRMITPGINPVLVGGSGDDKSTATVRKSSEQQLVQRAVRAMVASGVRFERTKVNPAEEGGSAGPQPWNSTQWIYRMTPSLDLLGTYETGGKLLADGNAAVKQRYAVRQVLSQEVVREERRRAEASRSARSGGAILNATDESTGTRSDSGLLALAPIKVRKDFFGRVICPPAAQDMTDNAGTASAALRKPNDQSRVWVTYHEGYSNAVRKPVSLAELMRGL